MDEEDVDEDDVELVEVDVSFLSLFVVLDSEPESDELDAGVDAAEPERLSVL